MPLFLGSLQSFAGSDNPLGEHGVGNFFEAGHVYEVMVYLQSNEEYLFSNDTQAYLNGKEAVGQKLLHDQEADYRLWYDFPATNPPISKVELSVTPPVAEAVPQETPTVPSGANYTAQSQWYDIDRGKVLSSTYNVFEKGHRYEYSVVVTPKEGYTLKTGTDKFAPAYLNGNTITYYGNAGSVSVYYYFRFTEGDLTGWQKIDGKWYYYKSDGSMAKGWLKINGKWYYFNTDGIMQTGWQKINSKWYYLESGGAMVTGWKQISGKWYYFENSGVMVQDMSKTIGGKTYYFNASGACMNP